MQDVQEDGLPAPLAQLLQLLEHRTREMVVERVLPVVQRIAGEVAGMNAFVEEVDTACSEFGWGGILALHCCIPHPNALTGLLPCLAPGEEAEHRAMEEERFTLLLQEFNLKVQQSMAMLPTAPDA